MPRPKMFTVGLSAADREFLAKLTTTGVHPARMIMRARVLLESDHNAGPVPDRAVRAAGRDLDEHHARDRDAQSRASQPFHQPSRKQLTT